MVFLSLFRYRNDKANTQNQIKSAPKYFLRIVDELFFCCCKKQNYVRVIKASIIKNQLATVKLNESASGECDRRMINGKFFYYYFCNVFMDDV